MSLVKRLSPTAAVLVFLAAILSCDTGPPDDGRGTPIVPAAAAAEVELAAQEADTFEIVATWPPQTFLGDTIRTYIRDVGREDGSWADFDTLSAVGSEMGSIPAPPAGSTAVYNYCLRGVGVDEIGDTVSTPDSLAACTSFQYTSPTSFPPPPDSVTVEVGVVTLDSAWMYDDRGNFLAADDTLVEYNLDPGETVEQTYVAFSGGEIVLCGGACDTVPIAAAGWDDDVPYYIAMRPGYGFSEQMARRLPWLRVLRRG